MAKRVLPINTKADAAISLSLAGGGASAGQLHGLLAAQPIFCELSSFHIGLLAGQAMEISFEPGQFIFKQRDPANRFYLIQEGEVSLEIESHDKWMIPIRKVGPGEALGWSWIFASSYFPTTARAIKPTKAIFFYGTILRQQCEDDQKFGYEMMKCLAAATIHCLNAFQQNIEQRSSQTRFVTQTGTAQII
jgi:CRP-like cAMP-binding protein